MLKKPASGILHPGSSFSYPYIFHQMAIQRFASSSNPKVGEPEDSNQVENKADVKMET